MDLITQIILEVIAFAIFVIGFPILWINLHSRLWKCPTCDTRTIKRHAPTKSEPSTYYHCEKCGSQYYYCKRKLRSFDEVARHRLDELLKVKSPSQKQHIEMMVLKKQLAEAGGDADLKSITN